MTDAERAAHRAALEGEPNPLWCVRHWAPCPDEGLNGIVATVALAARQLDLMPAAVVAGGPAAMNSWLAAQAEPTCCRLGDEAMAEIWADC